MKRTLHSLMLILVVLAGLGALLPAHAEIAVDTSGYTTPVKLGAGTWQTWVLASADQFRLPAPPDTAATAEEIADLKALAASREESVLQEIRLLERRAAALPLEPDCARRHAQTRDLLAGRLPGSGAA